MAGEIYYPIPVMPQGTIPRINKVTATLSITIDSPLPSRREALNRLRASWDIPYFPVISKLSLRQFYKPEWDVPDNPPLSLSTVRTRVVLLTYQAYLDYIEKVTAEVQRLDRTPNQRSITPALFPSTDNPPPYVLAKRLTRILEAHELLRPEVVGFTLPRQTQQFHNWLFIPPPAPVELGSIAFLPQAFYIGYPGRNYGYLGANRYVNVRDISSKPFIRIIPVKIQATRRMDEYTRGDAVSLICTTYDPIENPERPITPQRVTITLLNPDGTLRLDHIVMSEFVPGSLRYVHQTSANDTPGIYTGYFTAENYGNVSISTPTALFKLV